MKNYFKLILAIVLVFALAMFASCKPDNKGSTVNYDNGVVNAFNTVSVGEGLVSKTAVADGNNYLVTVITEDAVAQYTVNSSFEISNTNDIVGTISKKARAAAKRTVAAADAGTPSALERAYTQALALSGLTSAEIESFDFDREVHRGMNVYKVELENAEAEYEYIFNADDFTLVDSKIEFKNSRPQGSESSYIGEAKAAEIAFDAANIAETDAGNVTVSSVLSEGRRIYKVKFDFAGNGYRVDVDALTGKIVRYAVTVLENAANPEVPGNITEERAKEIAINFADHDGSGSAVITKFKLDYDDGRFIYEVEVVVGGTEYELEILASDGTILDVEIEAADRGGYIPGGNTQSSGDNQGNTPTVNNFITREQAIAAVKEKAGADAFILDAELEQEWIGGVRKYYYEVEVRVGRTEYDYYVDAVTGDVTLENERLMASVTITEEEAVAKALAYFNLTEKEVRNMKIKLDDDDGRMTYEIEFYVRDLEYEIEMDASTGNIIDYEIDYD